MTEDQHVSPEMWSRIAQELTAIEAAHQVRIILAVESGSRAWRFPSPDSDYDVRFIYLRPAQDYLAVTPLRDVIEKPLDAVLDINGWDIRKALGLMAGSNAVLQEWLTSPIRYRADAVIVDRLRALAQETADLDAFRYHYDRMARRHFEAILETETPRLKSYFYALRPVFALHWLGHHHSPPPMDLPSLMAGREIGDDLRQRIEKMVARKAEVGEQAVMARNPVLDDFIAATLATRADRPPPDRAISYDAVNAFFSGLVKDDLATASQGVQ